MGKGDVAPLADERVATQLRLDANLILLFRLEPHLDQCVGTSEHSSTRYALDRVHAPRIVGPRLSLEQCLVAPRQAVAPFAGVGACSPGRTAQYTRSGSRRRNCCFKCCWARACAAKRHQARGVAVDPVHDQRQPLVRSPVLRQEIAMTCAECAARAARSGCPRACRRLSSRRPRAGRVDRRPRTRPAAAARCRAGPSTRGPRRRGRRAGTRLRRGGLGVVEENLAA